MKLEDFITKREFLYHLTDKDNLEIIKRRKELLSTESIIDLSLLNENEKESFLSSRRKSHEIINIGEEQYKIRDQRPISLVNLFKCLTSGFTTKDFFQMLNSRVFFWPTIQRLERHYNRYKDENPIIIKVPTRELLELNNHAEFCRLNSGATRSNPYLNGAPPERGTGTFSSLELFKYSVGQVAEVTFPKYCKLPSSISIGNSPEGPWKDITL